MEELVLPQLEKSTSVDANFPEKQNRPHFLQNKYKVGSFPQLPQENTPTFNRGLLLAKKYSCFERMHDQPQGNAQRKVLYGKVLTLIQEMITNPDKYELLLSALQSMENSVKNGRMSKGSIEIKHSHRCSVKNKFSQRSIEAESPQKMAISLKLSEEGDEVIQEEKTNNQICAFMAQSIEIEYPYEGFVGDKTSLTGSEDLKLSHFSAAKSIEEEMLDSLHFPEFTDMYKRISLLLVDEEPEGSDLCSSASSASPDFPSLSINQDLVIAVFGEASPLLMNLALSLLFKFMLRSKIKLSNSNAGWLLAISALVGYKIFYDETLQGILEYFASILKVSPEQTARLQRWFLAELNYEVLINNKHYTEIMIKLMGNQ